MINIGEKLRNRKTRNGQISSRLIGLLLIAALVYAYWPIRNAEFIYFDDQIYVTNNDHVKQGLTPTNIVWAFDFANANTYVNWHPLTVLSHMGDYELYGSNAAGHHITNLIFHIGNSLLLLLFLWKMTGALGRSAVVAFLFGLHPLHVESVAWISERKDVLCTFFFFLAVLTYNYYVKAPRKKAAYAALLLFFLLALFSKPMAVTLPFVLLLLDIWPLRRFRLAVDGESRGSIHSGGIDGPDPSERLFVEKVPLFIISGAFSVLTFIAQYEGGAVSSFGAVPLWVRLANTTIVYVQYIVNMIMPIGLGVFYPHPGANVSLYNTGLSAVFLALVCCLAIKKIRTQPFFFVGWFWYLGMLVPVIGIVQVGGQAMADRYTYISLVGLFIILAWLIPGRDAYGKEYIHRAAAVFLVGLCIVLAVLTRAQVGHWTNTMNLFVRTDRVTEKNIMAKLMVAGNLATQGKKEDALERYAEILALAPNNVKAHFYYGSLLLASGETEKGLDHLREARRIQPTSIMVNNGLGVTLVQKGDYEEAERCLRDALALNEKREPTAELISLKAQSYLYLAFLRQAQKRNADACVYYRMALQSDPKASRARLGLVETLVALGKPEEALHEAETLVREDPRLATQALLLSGNYYASLGQFAMALQQFDYALMIEPKNTDIHIAYARTLSAMGKTSDALVHLNTALREKPNSAAAYEGLADLKVRQGNDDQAIAYLEKALQIEPGNGRFHIKMSELLRERGEKMAALGHIREAVMKEPANPEYRYRFAMAYMDIGDKERAKAHLKRALDLKPDFRRAKEALRRID